MDMDGVDAQVIYGPVTGMRIQSEELKAACYRAYNDWAAEFSDMAPHRLCVLPYLPSQNPAIASAELQRAAGTGHRGAVLRVFELGVPLYDCAWDRLWSQVERAGLPLSFHLGGGFHSIPAGVNSWRTAAFASAAPMQLDEVLAIMVLSGALDRHPAMHLVLGESGLGWIPYLLERMDLEFDHYRHVAEDLKLSALPSEIFSRQVYATFQEDRFGLATIDSIGSGNVMWASDYPHVDSTFPHSMRTIERSFAGLSAETIESITFATAKGLYWPDAQAGSNDRPSQLTGEPKDG